VFSAARVLKDVLAWLANRREMHMTAFTQLAIQKSLLPSMGALLCGWAAVAE
jgi:hypothetical protein